MTSMIERISRLDSTKIGFEAGTPTPAQVPAHHALVHLENVPMASESRLGLFLQVVSSAAMHSYFQ